MTKELKWIIAAIILNLILTIVVGIMVVATNPNGAFGITSMRVEDYIPVIRENAGYYSDEPIYTTDTLRATGAATLESTLALTGAATLSSTLGVTGTSTTGRINTDELTQGGGQCTITDANGGTYTLTQNELKDCNYLYMTASGGGQEVIALTLPATSTMTLLLPDVGDYREWLIDASDLAAATTTTITKGTGIDMIAVTNAEDVIDGGEYSELRCWRKSDTDVSCVTSELVDSD